MRVLYVTVPPGDGNFKMAIKMFQAAGCKVDDPGTVSGQGRDLEVWIPDGVLADREEHTHVGYFLGEAPCDVCGKPGCSRSCTVPK